MAGDGRTPVALLFGAFRPDLGEQIGQRFYVVVVERGEGLESFDVAGKPFSELFGRGIVEERLVLIEVRDYQGIAQLLGALHGADTATEDGLELAQGEQRFHIEELITAGLEQGRDVGGVVISGEGERVQWRHLAGLEFFLKRGETFCGPIALRFDVVDVIGELFLERGQDQLAPPGFLEVFLVVGEPEGRVSAEENEEELGGPFAYGTKD